MNSGGTGKSLADRKKLKSLTNGIAHAVCFWMLEFAEQNAERIAYREFRNPFDDPDDLGRSMARLIYYSAEDDVIESLRDHGLVQYSEQVEQVCIDEIEQCFASIVQRFAGTGKPGPVEIAIEDAVLPLKAGMGSSLLGTLLSLEEAVKLEALADYQRRVDERRRAFSRKGSGGWFSAIRDFFRW